MSSYSEKFQINCGHADPGGCICMIYFQDCNLRHVFASSNYTWSRKNIPEVEWDTQEETQPLELPHRLTHICCEISSPSPGFSYDQQCYQWFTGKLNCFMDTYPPNSAGQSTEATHPAAKWSLSDRFMFNTNCIFCQSDRCEKVKKAHHWTKEPLSEFEFGGGETVIRTAEAKNKIMIFFYGSKDRTFVWGWGWGGGGGGARGPPLAHGLGPVIFSMIRAKAVDQTVEMYMIWDNRQINVTLS